MRLYDLFQGLINVFRHRAVTANVEMAALIYYHCVNLMRFRLDQVLHVGLIFVKDANLSSYILHTHTHKI